MKSDSNQQWTRDKIKTKLKILQNNEAYRIGDCLRFAKNHKAIIEILKNPRYKDTLLFRLFQQLKKNIPEVAKKKLFFELMISEYQKNIIKVYDDDFVVVHIRLGDDLNNRCLNKKNQEILLKKLKEFPSKKIIIVTALHYGHSNLKESLYNSKTFQYTDKNYEKNLDALEAFISELENPLEDIISSENIDNDFICLVFSSNMVHSQHSGRFSCLAHEWHCEWKKRKND